MSNSGAGPRLSTLTDNLWNWGTVVTAVLGTGCAAAICWANAADAATLLTGFVGAAVTPFWGGAAVFGALIAGMEIMTRVLDALALKMRDKMITDFEDFNSADPTSEQRFRASRYARKYPSLMSDVKEMWARTGDGHKPLDVTIVEATNKDMFLNAAATEPYDKQTIIVSESLMDFLTNRELRAIIGHEMSHLRSDHHYINQFNARSSMMVFLGVVSFVAMLSSPAFLAVIPAVGALIRVIGPRNAAIFAYYLSNFGRLGSSRHFERMADRDGALLSEDPYALASAMRKMQKKIEELAPGKSNPHGGLTVTHPGSEERVANLLQLAREMKAAGMNVREPDETMDLPELSRGGSGSMQLMGSAPKRRFGPLASQPA